MVDLAVITMVKDIVTILGVIGGFTYYVMTVRNAQHTRELTLKAQQQSAETRQAQLYMQIFNQWNEREFWEDYFSVMEAEFSNIEEYESIFDTPAKRAQVNHAGTLIEGVGSLLHKGLIDPVLVSDMLYSTSINFWNKMKPIMQQLRQSKNNPRFGEYTEYLLLKWKNLVHKYDQNLANNPSSFIPSLIQRITNFVLIRVSRCKIQ